MESITLDKFSFFTNFSQNLENAAISGLVFYNPKKPIITACYSIIYYNLLKVIFRFKGPENRIFFRFLYHGTGFLKIEGLNFQVDAMMR